MTDLPRHIPKEVKRALRRLDCEWRVERKRNHYFVVAPGADPVCIGGNSSPAQQSAFLTRRTIDKLKKLGA